MISTPMNAYHCLRSYGLPHETSLQLTRTRQIFEYAMKCFGFVGADTR